MIECPCKHCTSSTGRKPGCHDHCEKPEYLDWRRQERERKTQESQERALLSIYQEVKSRNVVQTKRKAGVK